MFRRNKNGCCRPDTRRRNGIIAIAAGIALLLMLFFPIRFAVIALAASLIWLGWSLVRSC